MRRNDLLCWMDLEMTSVEDATEDQIIEIAVLLTDQNLQVVAEGPSLVVHADDALFANIPESARELHERTGLREAVRASATTLAQAEKEVLAFLTEQVEPKSAPLCGNSIHVDRHFLSIQMPRVETFLFYRCIDVSTVKELARRWAPAVYEEARARKGESAHRARDDIGASIAELAFYRGAFFSR